MADHHHYPHDLSNAASQWQTPQTDSFRSRGGDRKNEMGLDQEARNWPTPDTQNHRDGSVRREEQKGSHALSLHHAVDAWATPNAHDGRRPGSDETSTQGRNLKRESEAWATPASRDAKGANGPEHMTRERPHEDQLANQVAWSYSHLGRESESDGSESSQGTPSSRRQLNPLFVEWLMGWPRDLTSVVRSGYGSREMESFRSKLATRLRCLVEGQG